MDTGPVVEEAKSDGFISFLQDATNKKVFSSDNRGNGATNKLLSSHHSSDDHDMGAIEWALRDESANRNECASALLRQDSFKKVDL